MVPSSLVQLMFGALAHILAETLAQISDRPSPTPWLWALATTVQCSTVAPDLIFLCTGHVPVTLKEHTAKSETDRLKNHSL